MDRRQNRSRYPHEENPTQLSRDDFNADILLKKLQELTGQTNNFGDDVNSNYIPPMTFAAGPFDELAFFPNSCLIPNCSQPNNGLYGSPTCYGLPTPSHAEFRANKYNLPSTSQSSPSIQIYGEYPFLYNFTNVTDGLNATNYNESGSFNLPGPSHESDRFNQDGLATSNARNLNDTSYTLTPTHHDLTTTSPSMTTLIPGQADVSRRSCFKKPRESKTIDKNSIKYHLYRMRNNESARRCRQRIKERDRENDRILQKLKIKFDNIRKEAEHRHRVNADAEHFYKELLTAIADPEHC